MLNRLFKLILTICLFSTIANAQTSEGNLMLGGHFSAKVSRQEKLIAVETSPQFGLFVNNNLSIGVNFDIAMRRYGETNKHLSLAILPSGRYYFGRQKILRPFFQIEAGYQRVNISVADIFIARSGIGGGVGGGLAYFFNQSISIEGLYRLRAFRYTDQSSSLQNDLTFGLHLYIPSRRINSGRF